MDDMIFGYLSPANLIVYSKTCRNHPLSPPPEGSIDNYKHVATGEGASIRFQWVQSLQKCIMNLIIHERPTWFSLEKCSKVGAHISLSCKKKKKKRLVLPCAAMARKNKLELGKHGLMFPCHFRKPPQIAGEKNCVFRTSMVLNQLVADHCEWNPNGTHSFHPEI